MIAIEPGNRYKMIKIIADVLEIGVEISPLLKPIYERDELVDKAPNFLREGSFNETVENFNKIADLCIELGEDSGTKEYYKKSEKLKYYLQYELG